MTYELAKQLKDAGFPLKECNLEECYWDGGSFTDGVVGDEHTYHFPTLSELIEACGDGFESMTRSIDGKEVYWWASSLKPKLREFNASTPEEAVAKLFLELNKK